MSGRKSGAASTANQSHEQILALFMRHGAGFVSGEDLSDLLGVSRTAIWKQIKRLRDMGYSIEAVPSQGYRLIASPDILSAGEITAELATRIVGKNLCVFNEIRSTNTEAFRLAEEGSMEGTVVLADAQTGGKGRLGRIWTSPPGVNIYCSVVLRPPVPLMQASQMTFITSLAASRSIEHVSGLVPVIKWPNDLLLNGAKVAGILNELSAETEKINFLVLGIGINVNMTRSQFPEDLRYPATSLAIEGNGPISRSKLVKALLTELDALYTDYLQNGFAGIRREWELRSAMQGKQVKVSTGDHEWTGMVKGIDDFGALLVQTPAGIEEKVLSGDVSLLP